VCTAASTRQEYFRIFVYAERERERDICIPPHLPIRLPTQERPGEPRRLQKREPRRPKHDLQLWASAMNGKMGEGQPIRERSMRTILSHPPIDGKGVLREP
jgi:hypothetical protein